MNTQELAALEHHLQKTLSPDGDTRRSSEKVLENIEKNPGYAIMLLQLVEAGNKQKSSTALAAAITFKNFISRSWKVVDQEVDKISAEDRNTIKSNVVNLMLHSPEMYQKQLGEAISFIGREDFPEKWPNLLVEMKDKFASGDFSIINGVLRTAHTLFKRYRHEFRSDKLFSEINHVLSSFAQPLTSLFDQTVKILPQHLNNKDVIKTLYSSLVLIAKIFYSLNYQDLPEFFEDNMEIWMKHFLYLLKLKVPVLQTDDCEEAGYVEFLKSQICENAGMYAQKYDKEFSPYLNEFAKTIWDLLVETGPEMKYDLLVSNAINYLRSICERARQVFEQESDLLSICEKVIIPNMEFRPSDEEQFEDNPDEYIRRDMEGSDVDTRRRAACDLVRAFTKQFEAVITEMFTQYIRQMLQSYAENPTQNWKNKDAAIYLVTSMAQKGSTARHGTTRANEFVNYIEFFRMEIIRELQDEDIHRLPVLKADALRFVVTFRNLLGKENLMIVFPYVVNLLGSNNRVVHTYAAHVIERLLVIKADNNKSLITNTDTAPHLENLLSKCFFAMAVPGSEENEYVMKALMRIISLSQEQMMPYMQVLVNEVAQKLASVSKNPSKPHFNHYLFESISLCIRITCSQQKEAVDNFEGVLFGIFNDILQRDITEFIPYVFQLMSLLLEIRDPPVPSSYMELFPNLLFPVLWERPGNIPPLVRLLQAIIEKSGNSIKNTGRFNDLLGVSQKLIASKRNDQYGFQLLTSIMESLDSATLQPNINDIFTMLLMRLMKNKTTKYVRGLLVFFSMFIIKNSSDDFHNLIEGLQPKMFSMLLEKVIIADMQKVLGGIERKTCIVGYTKLLTDCSVIMRDEYSTLWVKLLESLIGVFELPEDQTVPESEHFVEIDETPGYQTAYCQLAFAGKSKKDPVEVNQPKNYLAQCLSNLSKNYPGKIPTQIQSLDNIAKGYLGGYISAAQVQIS